MNTNVESTRSPGHEQAEVVTPLVSGLEDQHTNPGILRVEARKLEGRRDLNLESLQSWEAHG